MENVLTKQNTFPLESKKPLVKEFFDRDAEIEKHLKDRMPHVSNAVPKINKLYSSKNKLTHKYRVNWYGDDYTDFMRIKKIVASHYVEVTTTKDGRVTGFIML